MNDLESLKIMKKLLTELKVELDVVYLPLASCHPTLWDQELLNTVRDLHYTMLTKLNQMNGLLNSVQRIEFHSRLDECNSEKMNLEDNRKKIHEANNDVDILLEKVQYADQMMSDCVERYKMPELTSKLREATEKVVVLETALRDKDMELSDMKVKNENLQLFLYAKSVIE